MPVRGLLHVQHPGPAGEHLVVASDPEPKVASRSTSSPGRTSPASARSRSTGKENWGSGGRVGRIGRRRPDRALLHAAHPAPIGPRVTAPIRSDGIGERPVGDVGGDLDRPHLDVVGAQPLAGVEVASGDHDRGRRPLAGRRRRPRTP